MTSSRRWISVAAVGAICWATASAVNTWLDGRNTDGGWFNYAPNNGAVFSPPAGSPWRGLAIWLVAILLWFGLSSLILRRTEQGRSDRS